MGKPPGLSPRGTYDVLTILKFMYAPFIMSCDHFNPPLFRDEPDALALELFGSKHHFNENMCWNSLEIMEAKSKTLILLYIQNNKITTNIRQDP